MILLLAPLRAEGAQTDPVVHPTDSVLANGLLVSVLESDDVPMVSVLLGVRAGAATQRPGEAGVAHLYEHLLFRAYGGDPSSFIQEAGDLNASFNGSTGVDVATYSLVLPSENTEGAIELLGRLATRTRIRDRDLRAELPVVLDELARTASDPSQALARQVSHTLWGSAWHRFDTGGDSTSLLAVTADDLQARLDRYYVPNNSILIVTGDARPQDVFDWAADHFEDWDRAEEPIGDPSREPRAPLAGTQAVLRSAEVLEATIEVRFRAPGTSDGIEAVQDVEALLEVLDEPRGPFKAALVGTGPFQRLSVGYHVRQEAGTIAFVGSASAERALQAVAQLIGALEQLDVVLRDRPSSGIAGSDGGIRRAIDTSSKRLALDHALMTERTALLAGPMATLWGRWGGDFIDLESPFAVSRSPDEFAAIAEAYIQGQPKVLGLLAPPAVIRAFQSSSSGGGR